MTAVALPASQPPILVGGVWKRKDPSGSWVQFEVITFGTNPWGQRCAKGKTPSGKVITLNLPEMEKAGGRFEHVHDNYVKRSK